MATAPEYAAPAETPFTTGPDRRTGARSYAVPFIVAVTGHRDLVPDEIQIIRSRVRDCLFSLRYEYPSRIIVVMSSLADGADRLVAEEALKLGMPLSVVLPMPRVLYEEDFTPESARTVRGTLRHGRRDLRTAAAAGCDAAVYRRKAGRTARASTPSSACF